MLATPKPSKKSNSNACVALYDKFYDLIMDGLPEAEAIELALDCADAVFPIFAQAEPKKCNPLLSMLLHIKFEKNVKTNLNPFIPAEAEIENEYDCSYSDEKKTAASYAADAGFCIVHLFVHKERATKFSTTPDSYVSCCCDSTYFAIQAAALSCDDAYLKKLDELLNTYTGKISDIKLKMPC